MAELSITQHDNRVSIVGDIRTMHDRDQLAEWARFALARVVADGRERPVILDVAQAGYFDARALFTLQGIARRCLDLGVALVCEGASEELQEQLELTGLDQILAAYGMEFRAPDRADATGATP